MGTIKTTNIETITGSGTLTLGQSGETISVPSGATINLSNATQTGVGGVNTPAFEAYYSTGQSLSDNVWTKMTVTSETYDTDNAFDSSTNYRFTPQTAGKYFFYTKTAIAASTYNDLRNTNVKFYKNGSAIARTEVHTTPYGNSTGGTSIATMTQAIIDMNGSTDYVESYIRGNGLDSTNITAEHSIFGAYKIIGA